jgi:RHS repeat-associated protein
VTTRYVYDGDGRVMGEYGTSATDVKAEYIWMEPEAANDNVWGGVDGIGGYAPLAVASAPAGGTPSINWVHANHIGVPLMTTDASGNAVTPYGYTQIAFPGQLRTLPDLYYNRHRDYHPTTGRYIQADPIGLDGDANPYAYAGNNPLRYLDPMGLQSGGSAAVAEFAFEWWLKRQARPGRWTPWGRAWGVGEAIGADAVVSWYLYSRDCEDDFSILQAKTSRRSGKERASDSPSWAQGSNPDPNENCKQFATRLLNA